MRYCPKLGSPVWFCPNWFSRPRRHLLRCGKSGRSRSAGAARIVRLDSFVPCHFPFLSQAEEFTRSVWGVTQSDADFAPEPAPEPQTRWKRTSNRVGARRARPRRGRIGVFRTPPCRHRPCGPASPVVLICPQESMVVFEARESRTAILRDTTGYLNKQKPGQL